MHSEDGEEQEEQEEQEDDSIEVRRTRSHDRTTTTNKPEKITYRSRSPRRNRSRSRSPRNDQSPRRNRPRSGSPRKLRSPRRNKPRSRSPPRRRSPRPLKKIYVLITADYMEEREWRDTILRYGPSPQDVEIYDHLYPFRNAAKHILRQDSVISRARTTGAFLSGEPRREQLANTLKTSTDRLYGSEFAFFYFRDWYRQQSKATTVLICGLHPDNDRASLEALRVEYQATIICTKKQSYFTIPTSHRCLMVENATQLLNTLKHEKVF